MRDICAGSWRWSRWGWNGGPRVAVGVKKGCRAKRSGMQMRALLHAITPCKIDSRVFCGPEDGAPNHQSPIWQQFGHHGLFRERASALCAGRQPATAHLPDPKLPIIISLHQTINIQFDMIAPTANGNPHRRKHAPLLWAIMCYCS